MAVRVATERLAAANAAANMVTLSSVIPGNLSALKLLHIRFLCELSSNDAIPDIWKEVHSSPSHQTGLALLAQYMVSGMSNYRKEFSGRANIMHCIVPLYNFMAGGRFVNPGENPACPAGGMSTRTTLQGRGRYTDPYGDGGRRPSSH